MRMDLTKALARRIMQGDISIQLDGKQSYVAYDRIEVDFIGGAINVTLMAGRVELVSVTESLYELLDNRKKVTISGIAGRMPLEPPKVGQPFRDYIRF